MVSRHGTLPWVSGALLLLAAAVGFVPRDAGAQTVSATVPVGAAPQAVAVNPVTSKAYVANRDGNSVTVIDGANHAVTLSMGAGSGPAAIAINPLTNRIYVANADGGTVSVIDGATDTLSATVPVGANPQAIALNPVTNMIYVANSGSSSNSVTIIDGATNAHADLPVGDIPRAIAVNPVTNKIYVANYFDGSITVIDAANGNATVTVPTSVSSFSTPHAIAVNPVTNKIYVVNLDADSVTVINGADNSRIEVPIGNNPQAIAVNPVTNRIYVAVGADGAVRVIDGASDSVSATVTVGTLPSAIAVSPATNRIYVANIFSDNVTVINGADNTATHVLVGSNPAAVAVNPLSNRIYAVNRNSSSHSVSVIDGTESPPAAVLAVPPAIAIAPIAGDATAAASVVFNFTASSGYAPAAPAVLAAYFRIDGGSWQAATGAAPAFTAPSGTLSLGAHLLEAFAIDGLAATSANTGFGASPITGSIVRYNFARLPATATTVASDANPSNYGVNVTFTATISGGSSPTGTVQFKDGVTNLGAPVAVTGGQAQLTTSALATGSHVITAVYSGDEANLGGTSPGLPQTVNPVATTTAVGSSANPSAFGAGVTFTATVGGSAPTGTVQFMDGAATLGSPVAMTGGQAQLATSALAVGSHSITAVYSGDSNNAGSTSPGMTQVVNAAVTATAVGSSLNPSTFGASVTFTATISGGSSPSGSVQFKDNGGNLGSPVAVSGAQAQFSTNVLSVASHSITAVYTGDAANAGSTSLGLAQVVNQVSPSISFTSGVNPSRQGESVTFTATVSGGVNATGTVQFKDGAGNLGAAATLSGGVAAQSFSTLAPGTHSITAVYSGDSNNAGVTSSPLLQQVRATARGDFDGNGKSDVLWKHATSTQTYVWGMNGAALDLALTGSPASTGDVRWKVVGIGDFDGNGKSDVLFRNETYTDPMPPHTVSVGSGALAMWMMNGPVIASSGSPGTVADLGWQVQGVGDFDGDGKSDLLWMHTDGTVQIWLMNGATASSKPTVATLGAASGWVVQGVGDFNGDGKSDILWKHTNGQVVIWMMNGSTIASAPSVTNVGPDSPTAWQVKGVGDFNGDGKADILWRNDDIGGVMYIWIMNGAVIASAVNVTGVGTEAGTGWIVKSIGDYNGDGRADIFWKNDILPGNQGITYVWLMGPTGTSITTATSVTGVGDFNWQVQNPK